MVESVLIAPKFLVPIQPAGAVLTGHAVVFEGKQISHVGPLGEAIERWPQAERVDLADHALLPGFVNMHTHSAMTILRGYADDLELHSWLNNHIWPAEARFVSPEFVEAGSMIAIAEMIHGGTTCFNDFSISGAIDSSPRNISESRRSDTSCPRSCNSHRNRG